MREIRGKQHRGEQHRARCTPRAAALDYARRGWPVLPGVGTGLDGRCLCGQSGCPAPVVHPGTPELLAATADPSMIQWWWEARPAAPVLLATGGAAPCALSLPLATGRRALRTLDRLGPRTGPVLATPDRLTLLVAPYTLAELGETLCDLLDEQVADAPAAEGGTPGRLPASLRFHGPGGYVTLPPSWTGAGRVGWLRAPGPAQRPHRLPAAEHVLQALVAAERLAPGGRSSGRQA
ncbi:bifunctional DNA primase/polymerase [Streptomyces bohaiensis]|uniref:bifunctional DNA primase/polymerase n=1 Tax=Streptomyces bohaiensis TaxID=1431344 RepID=UPI003B79589F